MYNALVFDAERGPCHLVRSILLGKKIGVSLATSIEEARQKIETGLFDVLFATFTSGSQAEIAFLQHVNKLLPGLPIVTISCDSTQRPAASAASEPSAVKPVDSLGIEVCRELTRPLRVGAVIEAANRAIAKIEADAQTAREKQRGLVVSVSAGEKCLQCLATTAGTHGALLESVTRDPSALREFEEFFVTNHDSEVIASVPAEAGGFIRFKARVAFTEKTVDLHVKQVGLRFDIAAQ